MQLLVPIMIFSCVYMCVFFFRIYEFNSLEVILLLSAKDSTADIPSSSTTSARKKSTFEVSLRFTIHNLRT